MPTVSIPLSQGKFALIDAADYPLVANHTWYAIQGRDKNGSRWYAVTHISRKTVYMHRLLLGFPRGIVDHKNGDGLDNRRFNIRQATLSANSANSIGHASSGFRGVSWDKAHQSWVAYVWKNGKKVFQRQFSDPEMAARAYDEMARVVHGEFACLNFPNEGERGAKP